MKKAIALVWLILWLAALQTSQSQIHSRGAALPRSFPDGYLESSEGAGLVIFFTGDINGHYEPCG